MRETLHIIEPTLVDEAGHCYSFVASLCQAAGDYPLAVWCGHNAVITLPQHIEIKHYFFRALRRLQAFWLYRSLLRRPGRIFISTAGRTDLILLDLASSGKIAPHKVFLYVHWFKPSSSKRSQLKKIAQHNPELVILTPTISVYEEFRSAGFSHIQLVPYPITQRKAADQLSPVSEFSHLLFAGAARKDKGFSAIVDLVELLAEKGLRLPVTIQTSADHYNKYDDTTLQDLKRLEECNYPLLRKQADTLLPPEYLGLFVGAICLQPYNRHDFADRISGITLDALSSGCPVITLQGTWMGGIVEHFQAGIVIDHSAPVEMLSAVQRIIADYDRYRLNALRAGASLQEQHSPNSLFKALTVAGSETRVAA